MPDDALRRELRDELLKRLDEDPELDVSGFLERHPEHAAYLEEELESLAAIDVGLASSPDLDEFFGAEPADRKSWEARYELRGELGHGGMGIVYDAWDRELEREIALKVSLGPADLAGLPFGKRKEVLERFLAEARITAQLEHPNIVPVHETGRTPDGRLYYAMKVVRGRTLREIVEALDGGDEQTVRAFPLARQVRIVLSVGDALAFAHRHGVLHRDLKPENVMVGSFGEVQVMDWGLVKVLDGGEDRALDAELPDADARPRPSTPFHTLTGQALGSPMYMAPEQARGEIGDLDERTDVFGLGAVLCHLLSGNPPFTGETRGEILENARRHRLADPTFARTKRRVPRELQAVCLKALAADRRGRYESIGALAADLSAYLEDREGEAWRDPLVARLTKLVRRHPTRTLALAAVLLFVAVGSFTWNKMRIEAAGRAKTEADLQLAQQGERDRMLESTLVEIMDRASTSFDRRRRSKAPYQKDMLDALAAYGIPLDGDEPPGAVAAKVDAIGDRDLQEGVIQALYELGRGLARDGCSIAHERSRGNEIEDAARGMQLASSEFEQEHPDLVEFWPRLGAILAEVDREEWRRELWRRWNLLVLHPSSADREWTPRANFEDLSPRERAFAAGLLFNFADHELARELLDQAILEDPQLVHARIVRASMYFREKNWDRAIDDQLVACALLEDSLFQRFNLGSLFMFRRRGDDSIRAEEQFRHVIARDEQSAGAYLNLAGYCTHLPLEERISLLAKAATVCPPDDEIYLTLSALLSEAGRQEEALEATGQGLALAPDSVPLLINRAETYIGMAGSKEDRRWLEKAEEIVRQLEEMDPENPGVKRARAHLDLSMNVFEKTDEIFQKFKAGDLFGTKGKKEEARENAEKGNESEGDG